MSEVAYLKNFAGSSVLRLQSSENPGMQVVKVDSMGEAAWGDAVWDDRRAYACIANFGLGCCAFAVGAESPAPPPHRAEASQRTPIDQGSLLGCIFYSCSTPGRMADPLGVRTCATSYTVACYLIRPLS